MIASPQDQGRTAAGRVPRTALPRATILRRREVTDESWVIWLKPEIPFTFKPGQYCTLGVGDIERPYSIVSSPHEELLEIFIERVPPPEGILTPMLYELQEGDDVSIRPRPKGIFTLEPKHENHLMVSTVTGVAPYVSMMRFLLNKEEIGSGNFYLLQGASYMDEFAYDDELSQIAASHSNVTYVPTLSRPREERNAAWSGQAGRVNLIVEGYAQRFGLQPSNTLVYACGHPGMIEDLKERMGRLNFPVREERFWKD